MAALTRDDVLKALGSADDVLVEEILDTGVTREEFERARAWLANDEAPMNRGEHLADARVARVIALIEAADADMADEEGILDLPDSTPKAPI